MRVQGFGLTMAALALSACVPQAKQPDLTAAATDFATYCSVCHGPAGKGDGAMAAEFKVRPANLTTLAARNGGAFPTTRVMAQIWGYKGKKGQGIMPDFSDLMDTENVPLLPYDGGDGILTPTPIRLVQVAEYLKTIQVK